MGKAVHLQTQRVCGVRLPLSGLLERKALKRMQVSSVLRSPAKNITLSLFFDGTLFGCGLKGNQKETIIWGCPKRRHTHFQAPMLFTAQALALVPTWHGTELRTGPSASPNHRWWTYGR